MRRPPGLSRSEEVERAEVVEERSTVARRFRRERAHEQPIGLLQLLARLLDLCDSGDFLVRKGETTRRTRLEVPLLQLERVDDQRTRRCNFRGEILLLEV